MLLHQRTELRTGKMLEELIEETRDLYDGFAFLVGGVWRSPGQGNIRQRFIIGGLFFCSGGSTETQSYLGQE